MQHSEPLKPRISRPSRNTCTCSYQYWYQPSSTLNLLQRKASRAQQDTSLCAGWMQMEADKKGCKRTEIDAHVSCCILLLKGASSFPLFHPADQQIQYICYLIVCICTRIRHCSTVFCLAGIHVLDVIAVYYVIKSINRAETDKTARMSQKDLAVVNVAEELLFVQGWCFYHRNLMTKLAMSSFQ